MEAKVRRKSMPENPALVLIVEDDSEFREILKVQLESEGMTVWSATDGEEAVSTARSLLPDVILLDIMIPKLNGFKVAEILKKDVDTKHIPILMLTVTDRREDIIKGLDAGAIDYITKPFFVPELKARINSVVKHKKLHDELKQAKEYLAQSEQKYRSLVENASDAIMVIQDGITRFANPRATDLLCTTQNDLARKPLLEFVHPDDRERLSNRELDVLQNKQVPPIYSFRFAGMDQDIRWMEIRSTPITWGGEPATLNFLCDITDRKREEEEIRQLAYYDTLTGLPNRLLFKDHLDRALAMAGRHGRMVAILFLDLDGFKKINDSLGHTVGDLLLKAVADRLVKALRKSDVVTRRQPTANSASNLARFGGDEFVILITDVKDFQGAANVAERLIYTLSDTFILAGHEIVITTSIGISLYPTDGEDIDVLIREADRAMYHAKALGKNNYQFSRGMPETVILDRFPSEAELKKAVENEELVLYYQPKVEIETAKLAGMEALLRWNHPERGLISPAEFIPVAEESSLILSLAEWVLRTACGQNDTWQKVSFDPVSIAVNLSGHLFKNQDFIHTLSRVLQETGCKPECLEMEINEGIIMQDEKSVFSGLQKLKKIGIRLTIDDFGSGFSSLSYLKRLPLDAIKIDRSVVQDMLADSDKRAMTSAIVATAHSLGLKVIAVGVETQEQLDFLRAQGCNEVQGYLFSPPIPADSIPSLFYSGDFASGSLVPADLEYRLAPGNLPSSADSAKR
jgi:diguanylate cyclase (GGDEF)-like protein/PAS domain S-box-containing protein